MFKYTHTYIAACDKEGGIYHLVTNGVTVALKEKTELDRVMYMFIDNNKLYAVLRAPFSDSGYSGIVSFDIDDNGRLVNMSNLVSTDGEVCAHLCVTDGKIFAANYISGSVSLLGEKTVTHSGSGVNLPRQDKPHCHFAGISPDGKYILVCDLGLDTIFTYDINLNLIRKANVPAGYGARHLAFSNDGRLVYCVNELVSSVSVFEYNDGVLTLLKTYNALPDDFKEKNTAAAIRIDRDFLYVSNRGHNSIAVFKIVGNTLGEPEYFDCGGIAPRDININGDYLFSTNEGTNNVTLHKINNGKLSNTGIKFDMPDPLNVIFW